MVLPYTVLILEPRVVYERKRESEREKGDKVRVVECYIKYFAVFNYAPLHFLPSIPAECQFCFSLFLGIKIIRNHYLQQNHKYKSFTTTIKKNTKKTPKGKEKNTRQDHHSSKSKQ